MRKNRVFLNVSLLFLSAALGWYFRGVFDNLVADNKGTLGQTSKDAGKTGGEKLRSLPAFDPGARSARTGAASSRQPLADSRGLPAQDEALSMVSPPPILPDLAPIDVETDPATGEARLVRISPGVSRSLSQAIVNLPDLATGDVEVDPATGEARLVRRPPGAAQPPSPMTLMPPEQRGKVGVSPESGVLRQLEPDAKAPPAPKTPKK